MQNKQHDVPYTHQEYPKWVGDIVVQDEQEENAVLKAAKKTKRSDADKQ